jgi:PhzF family phenazine biosynthesis protein
MRLPLYLVDAFADAPFTGNAAAVCLLDDLADGVDLAWMQSVARELNQAATAFIHPLERPGGVSFSLHWFAAEAELVLCGHGTLAAAHVLWETGRLAEREGATFETASGILRARRDGAWITLDFPAQPARPASVPDDLLTALGVTPRNVARSDLDYLVELASEADVRAVRPDFGRLRQVETRGVIVTAPASLPGFDVVSRFFAPGVGIDEDAVTGSAHCTLGPYWAKRLGQPTLLTYQASARGGVVRVQVDGERVRLGGRALTVLSGTLAAIPPS